MTDEELDTTQATLAELQRELPASLSLSDSILALDIATALLAEVRRLRAALLAIVYASDDCQGHKGCRHSMDPWVEARRLTGTLSEDDPRLRRPSSSDS